MANFPDGSLMPNIWGAFKTKLAESLQSIVNSISNTNSDVTDLNRYVSNQIIKLDHVCARIGHSIDTQLYMNKGKLYYKSGNYIYCFDTETNTDTLLYTLPNTGNYATAEWYGGFEYDDVFYPVHYSRDYRGNVIAVHVYHPDIQTSGDFSHSKKITCMDYSDYYHPAEVGITSMFTAYCYGEYLYYNAGRGGCCKITDFINKIQDTQLNTILIDFCTGFNNLYVSGLYHIKPYNNQGIVFYGIFSTSPSGVQGVTKQFLVSEPWDNQRKFTGTELDVNKYPDGTIFGENVYHYYDNIAITDVFDGTAKERVRRYYVKDINTNELISIKIVSFIVPAFATATHLYWEVDGVIFSQEV